MRPRNVSPIDPWRGLTHPAWWVCLVLLLVNDHLLKGAGLLPGVVTGKLSDLAGLVVAPVLAAALLGARRRATVAAAFALVVAAFAAVKLSPAASEVYVHALRALGFTARNVCDATDLLAVVVLPLAWHVCVTPTARTRGPALQRLAVTLGGLACIATPQQEVPPSPARWQTSAWLVNLSNAPVEVRLRWTDAAIDCDSAAVPSRAFLRSAFGSSPLTIRLEAQQTFPLDRAAAFAAVVTGAASSAPPMRTTRCDAVLVQADNLPSTVLRWSINNLNSVPSRSASGTDAPGAVAVSGSTSLRLTAAPEVQAMPLTDAPVACEGGARFVVGRAQRPLSTDTIVAVSTQRDGCVRLELDAGDPMTLCVPVAAVPFHAGDAVRIATPGTGVLQVSGSNVDMTVYTGAELPSAVDGMSLVPAGSCGGHVSCGGWVQRYDLRVGARTLRPGDDVSIGTTRIFFGGALRPMVWPSACEPTSLDVITGDLVVVHGG